MKDVAIVTVRIFHSAKKGEFDMEIPLNISVYDFYSALNKIFDLKYDVTIREECYLVSENPIAFLVGDKSLSDYGVRDGSVIIVRKRESSRSEFLKYENYNYSDVSFDLVADLSVNSNIIIGNNTKSNLIVSDSKYNGMCTTIVTNDGGTYIKKEAGSFVNINGKQYDLSYNDIKLNNYDFIILFGECFYFYNRFLYADRRMNLKNNGIKFTIFSDGISALKYPKFVRNSRLRLKIDDEPIMLLAPKEKPVKPKSNLLLKLMPAIGMIALTILLRGVLGNTNLSFVLFSVCSMSIGALVSVLTIRNDIKEYNQQIEKRETGYRQYIENKKAEISKFRKEEWSLLNQIYYNYNETFRFVENFSGTLFDRTPEDDDFLELRIGSGRIEAIKKIDYKLQEKYESDDDELVDLPLKTADEFKFINDAPVLIRLKDANVVGVVGTNPVLYEMMKVMFFDLCIRHHYDDVMVFLMINENDIKKYQWVKWFKHINSNSKFRNIICDNHSKSTIFEYLYSELSQRENSDEKKKFQHIVVFAMEDYGIKEHPVSKYIEKAADYNCTFIFFENNREFIPLGCSQLVMLNAKQTKGQIIKNENTEVVDFKYVQINDSDLYKAARKLAPVYCEEISLQGELTKSITLYQLLGIESCSDIDLNKRWNSADVTKSLAAPIGVRAGNEIVYLDIHDGEKCHGPHGLVAGTTGSGKSELLMTYILSMAVNYSPLEVAFLIIDFKAGGMADHFRDLPHTLGIITNIDGKEIQRSLISIEAEIKRRQKMFAQAEETVGTVVDNIDKYIKAWKLGKVSVPLPHLIIIVDEFAELKAQYNDFMETLKSAARIGRTLGIHLILATQKPQGQIDPQIDSNSRFRLCLKVQSQEDSKDMIKTPLASEIKEAGRTYFMVQNSEIFDLVQTAYSGASADCKNRFNGNDFSIHSVDYAGRRNLIYQKKHEKNDEKSGQTQNEAVVKLISEYCRNRNIPKLSNICQKPLTMLNYSCHGKKNNDILVDLGVYDDPANQKQELYSVNMAMQHMLIIGGLQSGKTNILQLLIRDVSEKYSPQEVNIYIIDYSSMMLSNFSSLVHVGGVVVPNEDERLKNLFEKVLLKEIILRKSKFKSIGVSSFSAYKEAGYDDLPLIMLLIDNFTALKERNLGADDKQLVSILREGLQVGITVIAANSSTKGIDYRYFSEFSCRIGLHHSNSDEYSNLFGTYKMTVSPIPGRCNVVVEKKNIECQIFNSFEGEREINRAKNIKTYCDKVNLKYPHIKASLIPEIPESPMEKTVRNQYSEYFDGYNVVLGFDYNTLMPKKISLCGLNLMVSGTPQSGKGNFTRYIISCLEAVKETAPSEVIIFDRLTVKKFMITSQNYSCVTRYELSADNMADICSEWKNELENRKRLVIENNGDTSVLDDKPLLMMICEDSSKEMLEKFDSALFAYLPYKFSWIASGVVNDEMKPLNTPKLWNAKNAFADFLFFGSINAWKSYNNFLNIMPAEKTKLASIDMDKGDAFYIDGKDSTKISRIKTIIHQE